MLCQEQLLKQPGLESASEFGEGGCGAEVEVVPGLGRKVGEGASAGSATMDAWDVSEGQGGGA